MHILEKDILETINITPERPQTPYLARLTAQACAAKAISTQKSPTNSFINLEAAAQTNKLIELFTKESFLRWSVRNSLESILLWLVKNLEKAADETMHFFKLYSDFLKSNPAINSHTLPISPTIESLFKASVNILSSLFWTAPSWGYYSHRERNYHAYTRIIKQPYHAIENIWFSWTPDLLPMSKPGFHGHHKRPKYPNDTIAKESVKPLWKHN